jgi:hypothetical protein
MKTYKDLEFGAPLNGMNGLQARMDFENGYGISVVRCKMPVLPEIPRPLGMSQYGTYTNNENEWEVGIMKDGELTGETDLASEDGVLGHQTAEQVTEIMITLQQIGNEPEPAELPEMFPKSQRKVKL